MRQNTGRVRREPEYSQPRLKRRKAQGEGRYESWIACTRCHLSEHPAMLWRVTVRHAHKDPVFPQRRQRQTQYSQIVSNKAVQTHQLAFYFTVFFFSQQQLLPHTCNTKSHLSPGYSPRTMTVWQHARWLCMTVLLFHHFQAPSFIPCVTTILTQWLCTVWQFPSKRMENILQICSVAPIRSGSV